MANLYHVKRLEALRRSQNADGGWAYTPGKQNSWLEPTVYAALALHGEPESDRAWELVRRWQRPDGSWQLAANVPQSNWTSALAALLASVKGHQSAAADQWLTRIVRAGGWAWKDESAPAAEPTAWATLAMAKMKTGGKVVQAAREFLLAETLTPESCGLTLLAMQGSPAAEEFKAVGAKWVSETGSRLVRARLTLGLRVHGVDVAEAIDAPLSSNQAIVALEAVGARVGTFAILKAEATA